jgi:hypothetical protein
MENNRQEDVDLIYVLRSLKNGIFNVYKSIINLIHFSIKKIVTLLIFITICLSLALSFHYVQTPLYISEVCISHIRFTNDYCEVMISSLDSYITESNNNSKLAEKLGIELKQAKLIQKITYLPLSLNIATKYSDSTHVLLPFKVEVQVKNNSVLPDLQKGLLNYLENNNYVSQLKEIDRQTLLQTEARLNQEIQNLDSLKRILDKSLIPQTTGNGIILGEPINPVIVYDIALKLYEKKLQVIEKQKLNDSFQVMVDFQENKDSRMGKTAYAFIAVITGYFLGLIFLYRKKIMLKE